MTIFGVIWYQGESNQGQCTIYVLCNIVILSFIICSIDDHEKYNCTFPAMIHDWRNQWIGTTGGRVDPYFPFGYVQVSPNNICLLFLI